MDSFSAPLLGPASDDAKRSARRWRAATLATMLLALALAAAVAVLANERAALLQRGEAGREKDGPTYSSLDEQSCTVAGMSMSIAMKRAPARRPEDLAPAWSLAAGANAIASPHRDESVSATVDAVENFMADESMR